MQDIRLEQIRFWLKSLPKDLQLIPETLESASSDASFRRYFRLQSRHSEHSSLIVMDAPPEKENILPFIQVAELFSEAGILVPKIVHQNQESGFLLLTDLGKSTYLSILTPQNAPSLYKDAANSLIKMQLSSTENRLPVYDLLLLQKELDLFPEWFLNKHLGYSLNSKENDSLKQVFKILLENISAQPKVYVHRDFHSRNLMHTEKNNPGILDFQDAVFGPITYDLASLLRDAYIEWDEETQLDYVVRYWESARKVGLPVRADFSEFYKDFEWMGLQRHLKVLGIFARLYHRDGKPSYVNDLPLVLKYTRKVAERYSAFKPLVRILDSAQHIQRPEGFTF
ncbi:MAG: phosphotransferase [Betaproteobacteria bacterium]